MSKQSDDAWIVEERMMAEDSPTAQWIKVSQNSSYQPTQQWPEPGQFLVIQSKEQDGPA